MLDSGYLGWGGVTVADSAGSSTHNDAKDKIKTWLAEEGWQVTERAAPDARFALVAEDRRGHKMIVSQKAAAADRVVVQVIISLSDDDSRRFSALPEKKKQQFLWDLRFGLLQADVEFDGLTDPPKQIVVAEPIFYDALTKDLFVQRFSQVKRAMLLVLWSLRRFFAEPPPRMGFLKG
jgi:hypothetical protein